MVKNNVILEEKASLDFGEILINTKKSLVQELVLRQQMEYIDRENPRAHRWRPAIIRFALHIRSIDSVAYEAMRDSGFIGLPCSRTFLTFPFYEPTR